MRHPIKLPPNDITRDERLYIREIQEYLRLLSFHERDLLEINVDGIYGPTTRQAVRQFQRQFRMDESGVMNRVTWDLLFHAYRAVLDPSFPPQPPLPPEKEEEPEPRDRMETETELNRVG